MHYNMCRAIGCKCKLGIIDTNAMLLVAKVNLRFVATNSTFLVAKENFRFVAISVLSLQSRYKT